MSSDGFALGSDTRRTALSWMSTRTPLTTIPNALAEVLGLADVSDVVVEDPQAQAVVAENAGRRAAADAVDRVADRGDVDAVLEQDAGAAFARLLEKR